MNESTLENYEEQKDEIIYSDDFNNQAIISGIIKEDFIFNHEFRGKYFYSSTISVERNNGNEDNIPIIINQRQFEALPKDIKGKHYIVEAYIRSFDKRIGNSKHKLLVYLYSKFMIEYDDWYNIEGNNCMYLKGRISKNPYFKTKKSGKQIMEFFVSIERRKGVYDNIPCVAWNETACCIKENLHPGDLVEITGRFQSRIYFKKDFADSLSGEYKETYEVAVVTIHKVE